MLNFSRISSNTIIGKIFRFPLNLLPKNATCYILQGYLKGKRWIIGSSNHGCWLGSYEFKKQCLFSKTISKGKVVYDIGAHAGFYTLLSSELVGDTGRVFSFEPLPKNISYLGKHLQLNRCNNVTVIEAAVTEKEGSAFFEEGINSSSSHLAPGGNIKVRTVSLDNLVYEGIILPPDCIKIDTEGSEALVLFGAKKILMEYRPNIFLSTHRSDLYSQCRAFLESLSYNLETIEESENMKDILAFIR